VFAMEAPEDGLKGYMDYTKEPYTFYSHLFWSPQVGSYI
jgi:hypothetical protein